MRCSFYTKSSNYKLICKKNSTFVINNRDTCYNHAVSNYNNYVTFIQKIWRGYRKRLFINKVYKNLPNEIQNKILFYVRENYLIKKHHHDIISNILRKKFDESFIINLEFLHGDENLIIKQEITLHKLIYIFRLYNKYYSIAPLYNKLILRKYIKDLLLLVNNLSLMFIFSPNILTTLNLLMKNYLKLINYDLY